MTDKTKIENIWNRYISNSRDETEVVDLIYAKKIFCNISNQNVLDSFARNVIERTDELRFMPPELFNLYFHFFIDYILYTEHEEFFRSEIADCFTMLLEEKLDGAAFNNLGLIQQSLNAVDFLSSNINLYNDDAEIYGDLNTKLGALKRKLTTYRVLTD